MPAGAFVALAARTFRRRHFIPRGLYRPAYNPVAVAGQLLSAAGTASTPVAAASAAQQFAPTAAEAAVSQVDLTQITRHNFAQMLPEIKEAIADATFVAIDTEFSGLSPEGQQEDLYDSYEQRYNKLLAASQSFIIWQFGLSALKWVPARLASAGEAAPQPGAQGHYEARTFNFYVFPHPNDAAGWDRRFMCQASSLSFLADQKFDFNRVIYDGIPYLPLSLLSERLANLRVSQKQQEGSMVPRDAQDQAVANYVRKEVGAWLAVNGMPAPLQLQLPVQRATERHCTVARLIIENDFGTDDFPAFGLESSKGASGSRDAGAEPGDSSAADEEPQGMFVLYRVDKTSKRAVRSFAQRIRTLETGMGFSQVRAGHRMAWLAAVCLERSGWARDATHTPVTHTQAPARLERPAPRRAWHARRELVSVDGTIVAPAHDCHTLPGVPRVTRPSTPPTTCTVSPTGHRTGGIARPSCPFRCLRPSQPAAGRSLATTPPWTWHTRLHRWGARADAIF